jgi:hypothetical protein
VQEVFSDKTRLRGWDALKRRLAQLPVGATVVWLDRIPLDTGGPIAKGSERLAYPPRESIGKVRDDVARKNIRLDISEGLRR